MQVQYNWDMIKILPQTNQKSKLIEVFRQKWMFSVLLIVFLTGAFFLTYYQFTQKQDFRNFAAPNPSLFLETFNGAPTTPQPFTQIGQNAWDIAVHSRDIDTLQTLHQQEAHHGPECTPPLDATGGLVTHQTTGVYEDAVFKCKDHVMTAINEGGYGVIYLTPNRLIDISNGTTTLKFDVSTYRSASRDWIDLWITPYADNMQLPLDSWLPDLQGTPKNAIHIKQDQGIFKTYIIRDYVETEISSNQFSKYDDILIQSPKDRATFELQLSKTHIKFGMPPQPLTSDRSAYWVDTDIPELGWTQGVVQLGHHSYNPTKDCPVANVPGPDGTCKPNTWHWDNVQISNSIPFIMIKADKRTINNNTETLNFSLPAPENAHLRFSAVGTVEVSFNMGATYTPAARQQGSAETSGQHHPEHFSSYWTPIPIGTQIVKFKFSGDGWYNGAWPYLAKDFAIWALDSEDSSLPSQTPTTTATVTITPVPSTASHTPTPRLTTTNTPTPTATRTPTPTPIPIPTSTPTPAIATGDINRDSKIDVQDLSNMLSRWGGNDILADLNSDGRINTLDLSILLSSWRP